MLAESPGDIVNLLFSNEAINSVKQAQQAAGQLALSSVMADGAEAIYPLLHAALTKAIDHKEHDAVSPSEVKIFYTPAGVSFCRLPFWNMLLFERVNAAGRS